MGRHKKSLITSFFTKRLVWVFLILFILIIPLSVQAGFNFTYPYSLLANILSGEQVIAQEIIPTRISLNDSVLEVTGFNNPNKTEHLEDESILIVGDNSILVESGPLGGPADVVLPTTSDQISVYTVRKDDSLSKIAELFQVSVNTILWANDLGKNTLIHEGDTLIILPISGFRYTVKKGDTLDLIVKKYGGDKREVMVFNNLETEFLTIGEVVVIPNGEASIPVLTKNASIASSQKITGSQSSAPNYIGYYLRPISGGYRSQGIHGNNSVDIAGIPAGTPIMASASGTIIIAREGGYNGGYGNYIVIKHPNGTQTLYAHALYLSVSVGQTVAKGEVIGAVGSTGHSTGNHLHFEVRGAKNPF